MPYRKADGMSHITNLRLIAYRRPYFHDPLFISTIVGSHGSLVLFHLVQSCHCLVLRSFDQAVANFDRHWHDDGIWPTFQHHRFSFCTDQPRSMANFPLLLYAILRLKFLIHREGTWVHVHFLPNFSANRYCSYNVRYILHVSGLTEGDEESDIMTLLICLQS